jgi:hypothetical protein
MFYDVGDSTPATWGSDNTGTNLSDFPTAANMPIQYWHSPSSSSKFQFDNPYYVAPEPGYRYLAFYGETASGFGWFYELELSTTNGNIDTNNPILLANISVVGPILEDDDAKYNNPSCIFDGQYTQSSTESLVFSPNVSCALFYLDNSTNSEVQSGNYYTHTGSFKVKIGRFYGTNTNPNTFVDAKDEANWNYVCDLTMVV